MKVYVILRHSYEDAEVRAVLLDKDDAFKQCELLNARDKESNIWGFFEIEVDDVSKLTNLY